MLPRSSKNISQTFTTTFVLFIICWAESVAGQTIVGNRYSTSVSVDLSVLEHIGSKPNIPMLVQPSVRSLLLPNTQPRPMPKTQPLLMPKTQPFLMPNGRLPAAPYVTPKKRVLLSPPEPVTGSSQTKSAKRKIKTDRPTKSKVSNISSIKPRAASPASPKPPPPPPKITTVAKSSAPLPLTAIKAPIKSPTPSKQKAAQMALSNANVVLKRGQQFRFNFAKGSSEISKGAQTRLKSIAESLERDEELRLQLLAYAGGEGQTLSQARRTSLSHGLAIRSLLLDRGIRSDRIELRALGNKSNGGPPNRVDMIIKSR